MSEYYLADQQAEERARQRERERHQGKAPTPKSQDLRITLLGDLLFPSSEPKGCDPYNSQQGKSAVDAWSQRRERR